MNTLNLNSEWKFILGDYPDAWQKGYHPRNWEDVSLPHDWSVTRPFSRDHSSGTGYLAGGIGWYRKTFSLPLSYEGKKIWILFDGAYKNSQVWCNGCYLGKHPNGYTPFSYDITELVTFGEDLNQISVRIDHTDIADSRWFTGSGITRKVQILVSDPVYLNPDGVFFTTPKVSSEEALIHIDHSLTNDTLHSVNVTLNNQMVSMKDGDTISFESQCTLPPGTTKKVVNEFTLNKPKLWSIEVPNMYKLTTCLKAVSELTELTDSVGAELNTYEDSQENMVGIRSILFDANKGFFLNDESLKIKGVCVHHDAGCLGGAVPADVWVRRLSMLKEMGCNGIRMSHNPHMPELYDLCDAMGFLVIDEAFDEWEGPKNKWSTGHNVYPPVHQGYFEDFPQWHEQDLKALIHRDRNHPSVIMWSIGNEIDYPNDPYCHPLFTSMTGNNDANKPEEERLYNKNRPNASRLPIIARKLSAIVRQNDQTRSVTLAAAFPELSTQIGFIDSLDVVGYNYKEHLYEEDHLRFPNKPFIGSENGHSFQAWKAVTDHDYICGQYLWTGIDYLGEAHGWPIHGSSAGLLTMAGFKKPNYYKRQSLWLEKPVLKLLTGRSDAFDQDEWKAMYRSYNYIPGETIHVRCYTNLPQAELFCNNKSLGINKTDDKTGYITWSVPFEESILKVCEVLNDVPVDKKSESDSSTRNIVEDSLQSTKAPCNINLKKWAADSLIIDQIDPFLPSETITQIEVSITDCNGLLVPEDSTLLEISVSDNLELLGIENGDLADNTDYSFRGRRAYKGRAIIYLRSIDEEDRIITVKGEGLRTNRLKF